MHELQLLHCLGAAAAVAARLGAGTAVIALSGCSCSCPYVWHTMTSIDGENREGKNKNGTWVRGTGQNKRWHKIPFLEHVRVDVITAEFFNNTVAGISFRNNL